MCGVLRVRLLVCVVRVCGSISNKRSTQYICMLHNDPHPSISVSFPLQLKLFHLSFSPQQSTNSLSCQSKRTFMQPIINDTIHLAWSLSLSSALFLFHPLSLGGPLKANYHSMSHKSLRASTRIQSKAVNFTSESHFTCRP